MKKLTAVEWLFEEMSNIHSGVKVYVNANKKLVEQAKAMEKEQIMNAWANGVTSEGYITAQHYYNETYNK